MSATKGPRRGSPRTSSPISRASCSGWRFAVTHALAHWSPTYTSTADVTSMTISSRLGVDRVVVDSFGDGEEISGAPAWLSLIYTSDAADDLLCVDLGGRRII